MALTSVFVRFFPDYDVSISTLANRISKLAGQNVSRVDDVYGETTRYCILHFDKIMCEPLWDMLSSGEQTVETNEGPILISVNQTNGLDPKHDITQFILNDDGLYYRYFKSGLVRKWNAELAAWFETTENPFLSDTSSTTEIGQEIV
jgi:hypothetical protein